MTSFTRPISLWGTFGSYGRYLANIGTIAGGVGILNDGVNVYSGKMGMGKFSYRLTGYGASIGAASAFGGPVGVTVGVAFMGGEQIVHPAMQQVKKDVFEIGLGRFRNTIVQSWLNRR